MKNAAKYAKYIVIMAVVLGSLSGIFGKLITASPMAIGFYRQTFALPFFAVPVFYSIKIEGISISKKDAAMSMLAGVFLAGHFFSWYTAVQSTTIASAAVLAALQPLIVIPGTIWVFKKKVQGKAILGIFVALAGGCIVAGADYTMAQDNFFGDFMALLTAGFIGLYFLTGKAVRSKVPATTYIFLVFFSCWLCFGAGMLVTSTPFAGYPVMDWIWLIALTIFCQIGTHAVLNWSFAHVTSLYVSAWSTLDLVTATFFAFLIFGEIPTIWQYVGAALTVFGLVYYNRHEEAE